jgi:hypothetical protein
MKDPLELFGDLPDFPGSRTPKNRPNAKKFYNELDDRYNGAKSKIYIINGEKKVFFTVGGLAQALNRKSVTMRMWENRGWLPKPRFRTPTPQGVHFGEKSPKGRRLYSLDQVDFLIDAVNQFGLQHPYDNINPKVWEDFVQHIKNNYPR